MGDDHCNFGASDRVYVFMCVELSIPCEYSLCLQLIHVIRLVGAVTPIDRSLLAMTLVCVYESRTLSLCDRVHSFQQLGFATSTISNTEANQQPAAQCRRGDTADANLWKWV